MLHKKLHSWLGGLGHLGASGAVALLLLPALGTAATRTVTSLNDNGAGSLREAIGASVNGDTINFSVAGTITLTSGELVIGRSIAINGPTMASLTVSGNNASRVFNISSGISVNISNLTISRGTNPLLEGGGGILNSGTLTVNNSTFSGNTGVYDGGGIRNEGTLTVNNSTFSGNTAANVGYGGGIYNARTLTVNNSTFSGNIAGYGGGIFSFGTLNILNTISANNTGASDIHGPVISQGHNLIGVSGVSGGLVASDLVGTSASPLNPHLGPLQNNGGPTFTMALLPISAAIDAGDDAVLGPPYNLSTDQRGRARRTGDHVDIGAYEFGGITRLVTTTTDSGAGSLRGALALAMDSDRILFAPVVTGKIRLTTGELLINRPLTIVGPGAPVLAISGNTNSRVFHIGRQGNVDIYGLTITEGRVVGTNGTNGVGPGSGQDGQPACGGGVLTEGRLTLSDCMVTSNGVAGGRGGNGGVWGNIQFPNVGNGGAGGGGFGSGIYMSEGFLEIRRCAVLGNVASGGSGGAGGLNGVHNRVGNGGAGGPGLGGGVFELGSSALENCTVNGNQTTGGRGGDGGPTNAPGSPGSGNGGNGGAARGGALHGAFVLNSCTIAGNASLGGAGGSHTAPPGADGVPGTVDGVGVFVTTSLAVLDTIIAGNMGSATSPDVKGAVMSQGWNLIGITDGSSGWMLNDLLGNAVSPLNPLLSACQDNGGAVWTMCPLAGSPARDAGNSGLPTDARGGLRLVDFPNTPNAPGGDGSDIGALEVDSLFRITSISRSNTVARVRFKSDPGVLYTLQQTSVVTNHIWTNIISTLAGNGQELEATDTGSLPPWRFYRVRSN